MTILTAIFAFGYLIVNLVTLKDKEVRNRLFITLMFALFITSFFWLPMLETMLTTNYAAFEPDGMADEEKVLSYALQVKDLFATSNKSIYVFETGPHILIMLAFSVFALRRLDNKYKKEYILFLCLSVFCLFASTKYFPWKYVDNSLYIIQFPWRLLVFSNMFLAVICSINMSILIKNFRLRDVVILSTITLLYSYALVDFVPTTENVKKVNEFSIGYLSGREEEISAGAGAGEYLPTLADKNRFYIASREHTVLVLEGRGDIEDYKKDGLHLTCEITTFEDETIYEFPYIYYPGYKITIDGCNCPYYESENGLVAIALDQSAKYDVEVTYEETSLTKMSRFFSIISVIGYIVYTVIFIKGEKEKVKEN